MRARTVLTRLATVGLLSAAAAVLPAAAAQAAPTGCTTYANLGTGYASCTGGTGEVRVVIACVSVWGDETVRSGPFVPVGQTSAVSCPSSTWSLQPDPWYVTRG
ncbi:hypothetical protein [Polymorphospora rubra]|uniref:hypothetical protein n=1 Tax=Polymorphospora rubra TaxID=338584 RepID=UPI003404F27B